MRKLAFTTSLLLFVFTSFAQRYSFVNYTTLDGLPQDFIYSVFQDNKGNLVVGTGEGLSSFDGKKFTNYSIKNGLAENVITSTYKDESGKIYLGHNEGGITVANNYEFTSYKKETISSSTVTGITKLNDAILFCTQNDGLFLLDKDKKAINIFKRDNLFFYDLVAYNENEYLLGTSEGILKINIKNNRVNVLEKFLTDKSISCIYKIPNKEEFILAVNNVGLYKYSAKYNKPSKMVFNSPFEWENLMVSAILLDNNNDIWVSSLNKGVLRISFNNSTKQFDFTQFNEQNGFNSNFVKSLYEDHEGNIWLGTFGNGLSRHLKTNFTIYSNYGKINNFQPYSIHMARKGIYYGLLGKVVLVDREENIKIINLPKELKNNKITSINHDATTIWLGTEKSGVYKIENDTVVSKLNWDLTNLEKFVNDLEIIDHTLWVATEGGLLEYNTQTQELDKYNTESGLPHNNITSLKRDAQNNLFLGTKSNSLLKLKDGELTEIKITEKGILTIVDIYIASPDNFYLATSENGVIHITNEEISSFNDLSGLKSNYCYSIAGDMNGDIWVGHTNGLSRIGHAEIFVYDSKEGITGRANHRAIISDNKGNVLIGTSNGLAMYDTHKDKIIKSAPIVSISSIFINDSPVTSKELDLSANFYQIKFNFTGISFKNPEGVRFKYKLEGYDYEYSPLSNNPFASYGKLGPGEYVFKLIACNENGVCSEEIYSEKIIIGNFIWQKAWFYILLFFVLALIVIAIFRIRTHTLKQRQIQLEEEIILKTKEIVEQKDKIEDINKDLTDSINYAEKIQKRILPEVTLLENKLPGSFVYFKPRDIVSGDFYFFHETDETLVIAVADCTGHGVPGAFMSFIGSVSLRNIYTSTTKYPNPKEALLQLDYEVEEILKQREILDELDYFKTRDGMDVTICEINKATRQIKLSSAMRPFIVIRNGVAEIIRGTRNSIGGGNQENKQFELVELQLNRGDLIYLFSDGLTDQFGGPDGKKLKVEGAIEMLRNLHPTDSQLNLKNTKEYFENWLREHLQLDDVLLIAIVL